MAVTTIDCVIPSHGRPELLAECLRSVAQQTCPPDRVIVVSDNGDRRSRKVVGDFERTHPSADCLFIERTLGRPGASASRNEGARHGRSSSIAFLDDDDLWEPRYLESAADVLDSLPVAAVVAPFQRFSTAGAGAVLVPPVGLTARDVFRRTAGVTGSSIVIRRPAFVSLGGFDPELPVQNDRDLFLRLLASGGRYAVLSDPLVKVRDHDGGRLTDATPMRADGILLFLGKHGAHFSRGDRRILRYTSYRTRMSRTASTVVLIKSTVGAVFNWSPTAARQIPLGLLRRGRSRVQLSTGVHDS